MSPASPCPRKLSASDPASKVVPPLAGIDPMNVLGAASPVKVSVADPASAVCVATSPTCEPETFTVTAVVNAEKSTVLPDVASLIVTLPVPATK